MKKGVSLSINTIIIAIICLIVLAVIIAIFTGTINDIADKFRGTATDAGEKTDEAMDGIDIFACSPEGEEKCRGGDLQVCRDSKWEIKQECEDGCKDKACK